MYRQVNRYVYRLNILTVYRYIIYKIYVDIIRQANKIYEGYISESKDSQHIFSFSYLPQQLA